MSGYDEQKKAWIESERRSLLGTRRKLAVKRVGLHDLPLPEYASDGAAAFDLRAPALMPIYSPSTFGCGFAFEIPEGYVGRIIGRSGLTKEKIFVAPGVIDSDYRAEVKLVVFNLTGGFFCFDEGDRIAQMLIQPAPQFTLVEVPELSATVRGAGGFGHTGVR